MGTENITACGGSNHRCGSLFVLETAGWMWCLDAPGMAKPWGRAPYPCRTVTQSTTSGTAELHKINSSPFLFTHQWGFLPTVATFAYHQDILSSDLGLGDRGRGEKKSGMLAKQEHLTPLNIKGVITKHEDIMNSTFTPPKEKDENKKGFSHASRDRL